MPTTHRNGESQEGRTINTYSLKKQVAIEPFNARLRTQGNSPVRRELKWVVADHVDFGDIEITRAIMTTINKLP